MGNTHDPAIEAAFTGSTQGATVDSHSRAISPVMRGDACHQARHDPGQRHDDIRETSGPVGLYGPYRLAAEILSLIGLPDDVKRAVRAEIEAAFDAAVDAGQGGRAPLRRNLSQLDLDEVFF